jgi:hypothetical protein
MSMKNLVFSLLALVLIPGCSDSGRHIIGGVYYVCSNDLDHERRFIGLTGKDVLEDEAKKEANASCENLSGGRATQIVYIYKDGSQKSADGSN